MVKLSGTVQQFSKAFGANLRRCETNSRTDKRRTGDLTIPAELEPVVEGVFGLDNRPQAKAHFRILTTKPGVYTQAAAVSYSPVQVAKTYGFPSGATGAGSASQSSNWEADSTPAT
jgi:kumamolisin